MTRKTLKYISLLIFTCTTFGLHAQQQGTVVEGVAAVIGKNIILKSDVVEQLAAIKNNAFAQQQQDLTECKMLEELMMQKLLVHHAEIDSVEVSDEEVSDNMDRRMQQLIGQMNGDKEKLEEYYGKSILELKEEMRPLLREQLLAQRMQSSIVSGLEVTPTEVQEYYNGLSKDSLPLINTEVELSQIVKKPEVSQEAIDETIEKLSGLKERIENGSSFSSMAILYSEDPGSNKKGGEYKGIKRGQFVKEFEAVAFNLQPNEISDPFKTEYGYHIVQLLEKRGEELDLRHILIKPKLSQENLNEAKNFLDSLRSLIVSGEMTWFDAATEFSEDKETKFNGGVLSNFENGSSKFDLTQLDQFMYNSIKELEEGEISTAQFYRTMDQSEAFRLVRLDKRIKPHKANMKEDYQKLKGYALQKKQADVMQEWVTKKIEKTYIKINTYYFPNCTVDQRWTKLNNTKL